MINVLHFTNIGKVNGISSMLINYYKNIDREKFHFTFLAMDNVEIENTSKTEIENLGGKVIIIPHYKKSLFKFIKNIKYVLNNENIDILHLHQGLLSIPVILFSKKSKIILHSHNPTLNSSIKNFLVKSARHFLNKNSDYRLACSIESGRFLFGNKSQFSVLTNSIDVEKFKFSKEIRIKYRKELNISDDDFVYICVGRFSKQKNQEFLIELFNRIQNKISNFKLLLVGDNTDISYYTNLISEYKLENKVILLFDRTDISELYSASDCCLGPSIFEGFGISLLEAQANGLPCVFSKAIIKDIFVNDNVWSKPLDFSEWEDIVCNQNKLSRTTNLRNIKESNFNINNNSQILEKIYKKVYSLS